MADGVDLSRKFVSESELDEKRKKRQEEWEKVRKPDDPEEAPEEEYDPRSLFERLQEQKDKKQEEYEEQFKFKNMVKGLDEDETSFLDEVSRQQSLIEKHRRDEEAQEIKEYRSALQKLAATDSQKKDTEKKAVPKPSEHRTSHLSQAHLLAGAVKRRSSSQSSEGSKKQKAEESVAGNGSQTDQEAAEPKSPGAGVTRSGVLHLPSAAVCVGILPGLGAYSGSSDSESSSDSEGSVDEIGSPIKRHRLFR
ncbi:PSME3-interacting protein isoform X1 [Labeo rohita]|uniref:PSME3-interacting protein isoform X1 n=1 Tax=Labeo rohita TaxID=84645 RepID=UPI0021E20EC5|nr:PSME3-interacting protein isoform X1 [Labeo rohita]XP_050991717.1 PSME3-interacting protein isoform X1 [Labeo rohita]